MYNAKALKTKKWFIYHRLCDTCLCIKLFVSGEKTINALIHTHFDKCTGCSICQLVCSFDLFTGYNPRLARLAIRRKKENLYHIPVVCNQCENAYCMKACPVKAIQRNDEGIVSIGKDRCIGCGLCAQFCPMDMILLCPDEKKAYKCELCQGQPLCVKACPAGALELVPLNSLSPKTSEISEGKQGGENHD